MKIIFGVKYAEKCQEEAQEGWKEGKSAEGKEAYEGHKAKKESNRKEEII